MNIVETMELLLSAMLRMATPLLLASLGGMFASRCGIMPLGLEGMITAGAFSAVWGSYITGSPWIGLLFGMGAGIVFALLNAWLCIRYHVNHVICGLGVNMLILALSSILLQIIWGSASNSPTVASIHPMTVPGLCEIPMIGGLFENQSIVTYLSILAIPFLWIWVFRTVFGMRLRVIGNNPYAASTAGVNVNRYKYQAMILCGLFSGLAGSYLSLCQLNLFTEGMSAERGYISNIICVLGASNPVGILIASLFFGMTEAAQLLLQGSGIPTQLLQTIPYVTTIIALVFVKGNRGSSLFVGKHFQEV